MEWFTLKGIKGEIEKIRWPKKDELAKDSWISLVFILIFSVFFIFSDFLVGAFLRLIGVIV